MADKRAALTAGIAAKVAVLAALWWLIAQGQTHAWLIGVPAVALAATASVYLGRPALPAISPARLPAFVALFLLESVRGGLDVARRTLAPELRIQPGFRNYRLRLTDRSARLLLLNCISLLPGTLAARINDDHVELHLLDTATSPDAELLRLEQAVAGLFGSSLAANDV